MTIDAIQVMNVEMKDKSADGDFAVVTLTCSIASFHSPSQLLV
jgi:hypothetical protein